MQKIKSMSFKNKRTRLSSQSMFISEGCMTTHDGHDVPLLTDIYRNENYCVGQIIAGNAENHVSVFLVRFQISQFPSLE